MTTTPAPAPVDWNVCIGYLTPEHAHPESELRPQSFLCPTCDDRLNAKVAEDRERGIAARRSTAPTRCMGGDHAPGSRYYDCLACYGD